MKQAYLLLFLFVFTGVFSSNNDLSVPSTTPISSIVMLPAATISGTATVCKDTQSQVITFTGSGESAPYTFTYTINGGLPQTVSTTISNSVTVPVATDVIGTFTYSLISVSCATPGCFQLQNGSATVTVVDLPTATISGSVTICPNNSASFTITGTPNALIVIKSSSNLFSTVTLSATGTAVFTTPLLQETMTYTLLSATLNGCNNPIVGSSATATINSNGCATVLAGNVDLFNNIEPICEVGDVRQLTASYQDLGTTTTYEVSSIPYCPQAAFFGPAFTPVSVGTDDVWSGDIPLPFDFCFFGNKFTTANVGSNGLVSFNSYPANSGSGYNFNQTIPNTGFPWKNAIYGVLQDTNPSQSPPEVSVNYQLMGNYPCRKLVINFYHLGQFSCGTNVGLQTYQIVIYEISNIIEVYVQNRTPCNSWISGVGLIGIQNAAGTLAYAPPGRNTGNWSASNEAWRFTPNGPSAVTFNWTDDAGNDLGSNTTIDVAPAVSTLYTATAVYNVCGDLITLTKDVMVEVFPNQTAQAVNLVECTNEFDLTQNTATVLGALDPNNFEIFYHTSLNDAENVANPIANPGVFISDGQPIWMSIQDINAGGCIYIRTFLISSTIIENPSPQQDLCPGDDPAPFSVETTFNVPNGISYVYFNTPQTAATVYTGGTPLGFATADAAGFAIYDAPVLGTPGSLPNVPGTYYVYAIANPTPTDTGCRPFQEIIVIIGTGGGASIASSSNNVCIGDSATITFTAATGTEIVYTVNGGANQTIIVSPTNNTLVLSNLQVTTIVDLVSATGNTGCTGSVAQTVTINVAQLPTATISGTINVCQNATNPTVTFTGAGGAIPYTFTYTVNGGPQQTITSPAGSSIATISAPTTTVGNTTYTLVSVQNLGTPSCTQAQTGSAIITVRALPTATIAGTASVCQNTTAPTVTFTGAAGTAPYTFTYNIDGGASQTVTSTTGNSASISVSTATVGVINVNLVNVSDSSASACSQAQAGTATITVGSPPTIVDPTPYVLCDDNADGFVIFNLPTKNNEITGGTALTVQYFVTGSTTPIASPATFQNTTANTQTLTVHAFNPASPECYSVTTLQLIVNPKPAIAPIADYPLCESSTPADGIEAFDLSTKTAEIINGQANIAVTYYTSQALAQAGVAGTQINSAALYNSPTAVIWVRLQNTVTTCFAVTSFNLIVNPRPAAFQPEPMFECSTGAANTGIFDLTSNNAQVTGVVGPNITVTYYATLADAQGGINPLTSPYETVATTVFIRVYNSTTTCFNTTSVELNVTAAPIITDPTPLEVCDDNYDGYAAFNLTTKNDEITGGVAGLTVQYFETATSTTPITNVINYQIINPFTYTLTVHVFDPLAPECVSTTTLVLIVNAKPAIAPITAYPLCETSIPADGIEAFDLPTKTNEIINGQADITVTYYTTKILAQAGVAGTEIDTATPYNSPSAVIWVRLENNTTGCFAVTSFNLVVNERPIANEPAAMNGCSNGGVNTASFDLNLNNPQVNGATGIIITYHLTLADAQSGAAALPTPYVSGPAIIFIRVENIATGCYNTTQVQLNVTQGPTANTPDPLEVCDPNSDGYTTFNLADANVDISGGPVPAGVTITYHETPTDALFGENALPSIYDNNVAYLQTIWVNVSYTLTGCSNVVELQLIVHNTPVATEIPALEVCDNNADGFAAFDLTTAIAPILNTLDPIAHAVTFHTTLANATAGVPAINNVTAFTNTTVNTQTIWVRVENRATGCFDVIELDLIVNALPLVAAPIPAYTLCDVNNPGDQKEEFDLQSTISMILNGQDGMGVTFYFDQANAIAETNALPNLYTNTSNAQTIWVRVENLATGCYVLSRMDLRVEPLPVLYPPTGPVVECDQDGNGFAIFDLDELVADLLQGEPNTDVTFHLTEQDALTSSDSQASPFENTTAFIDFIWVRAENTVTGCFSILAIELNVTAAPKIPALDPIVKCDEDSNNQNGFTTFDLTVQTPIIVDAQIGAGPYTVTYYTSQAAANAGVAPIIQDTFYTNTINPQTIWVRIDDDNSDCFAVKSFEISVNLPILLTRPTPLSLCDDGPTTTLPQTVFDLTVKNEEIVGTAVGYSIVYFPSWADAQAGTNAIADPTEYTNIANAQTLGVMVTSADGCISYTTMDIRVLPLPTPRTDLSGLDIEGCEDTLGSEEGVFDLTQNEEYIADEDPNLVFEYYLTEQDAIDGVNAIADPTNYVGAAGTIWIKVMNSSVNYLGDNCYVIIHQEILVNGLPILNDPTEYLYCDIGATGTAEFTLDTHNDQVLEAGQDIADFTFAYYLNQADAEAGINQLPNLYTNITNPQDIVVAVTHGTTDCKSYAVVTLIVAEGAVATTPTAYATCDTDVDGILIIDLATLFDTEILGAQAAPEFTVSYYPTLEDAQAGTNAIDPATAYPASTSILFAAVNNTTTGCRSIPVEVDLTIEALPNPVITANNPALCVDFVTGLLNSGVVLDSNLDPALYTFEWSLGGVVIPGAVDATYSISTDAPGVYSVVATSVSALGCPSAAGTYTVIKSGPAVPVGEGFTVSNAFTDNQTLTVTVEGFGDYVYSLDNGPFLDNDGIFLNITPGSHTVVVRDLNSCAEDLVLEVFAINYPHFFTPNGDGYNDTWNITTLASDLSAKIYIFDRYGKLIKEISPRGDGWNGTFNGKPLPSSDYWFTVFYTENGTNKEFKAHFSLKR